MARWQAAATSWTPFTIKPRPGSVRDLTAKNSGGWSRTNTHPASTGCSTLELHRIKIQRRRQESNLLGTGLQPVAWPSSPGVGVQESRVRDQESVRPPILTSYL